MKPWGISMTIVTTSLLLGCGAASQTTSQLRKVTTEEAFSFIRARTSQKPILSQESKPLYVQPLNKSEPCKLPTNQNQLDRNNFRAYWDGQCKGGFAYGLGRDIAISDTHHVEEITVYEENGKIVDSPAVMYDFVHSTIIYSVVGSQVAEKSFFSEIIKNEPANFNISYELRSVNNEGDVKFIKWSPFSAQKTFLNVQSGIVYRYINNELPTSSNSTNPVFLSETLDKSSGVAGGFAAAKYANGQVRHFELKNGPPEPVELPQEYIAEIDARYKDIVNAQAKVARDVEKAKIMEKEYLYLACNGKHEINGLKNEIAREICTWRDQYQEPFKAAQNQYNISLEKMKSEARSQEEQRRIQEQLDNQRRMARAAERQASAAENANLQNMINQYKPRTCYSNFGITTCY